MLSEISKAESAELAPDPPQRGGGSRRTVDPWEFLASFGAAASAAILFGSGYSIWLKVAASLHVIATYASLACYVLAAVVLLFGFNRGLSRQFREWLAVGGILFAFLAYASMSLAFRAQAYSSDSMLFNAYAAQLLMHGINPYTRSLKEAFDIFGIPANLITPTLNGQPVYVLSYPALSFLVYLPSLAIGVQDLLWTNVLFHLAVLVAFAVLAPPGLRAVVLLVAFADASYLDYTLGSVTDMVWVLPAVFAAYWWRSRPVLAALCLGLACATKQTPWVIVPFGAIFWLRSAIAARSWRGFADPIAALVVGFVGPNAAFIAWNPSAWFHGVGEPLAGNLVAFGSGLVQLSMSNQVMLARETYSQMTIVALLLCLVAYLMWPRQLAFLPFAAPVIVFFFATRSLQNYFMYWPLVLTGFALDTTPDPEKSAVAASVRAARLRPAWVFAAAGVVIALGLGSVVYALGAKADAVKVTVLSHGYDAVTGNVNAISVRVDNPGDRQRVFRFGVVDQGQGVNIHYWDKDPAPIDPHSSRTVRIVAGNQQDEVGVARESVQVVAFDAISGDQILSQATIFYSNSAGFKDPLLRAWTNDTPSVPIAWDSSRSDFALGVARRVKEDGENAIRFTLNADATTAWHVVTLSQTVYADAPTISVRLKPYTDYVGDAYPLGIFGLELVDSKGLHHYFTIDSRLSAPRIYRRDLFVVHVLPGELHAWNKIKIDLNDLAQTGFVATPESQYKFSVMAAAYRDYKGTVEGEFGGVETN